MRNIIVPAFAALSLNILASPALAEEVTISIPYGDLDISSPRGIATLEGRIQRAIRTVCGKADALNSAAMRAQRRCRREAQTFVGGQLARLIGAKPFLTLNQPRNTR